MAKAVEKIGYPETNLFNPEKEAMRGYEKLAQENIAKSVEIQENALPSIIPEKIQKKAAKVVRAVVGGGMVAASPFVLSACKEAVVENQPATPSDSQEKSTPATVVETATTNIEKNPAETIKPETTTEVINPNKKEIKNVEELIGNINIITDESMAKSIYPVKEVVFREPKEEGEKNLKKALAYTWTLILSKRGPVNGLADNELLKIPEDQVDARIDKLLEKINNGEDLKFEIIVKDDYANTDYYHDPSKNCTVDLTKDIDIIFYDKIPDVFTDEEHPVEASHKFMIPFWDMDGKAPFGWRFEVKEDGGLTIHLVEELRKAQYKSKEIADNYAGGVIAAALSNYLIDQKEQQSAGAILFPYPDIFELINPGLVLEKNTYPPEKEGTSIFSFVYID
jgi:hypothetical protein